MLAYKRSLCSTQACSAGEYLSLCEAICLFEFY